MNIKIFYSCSSRSAADFRGGRYRKFSIAHEGVQHMWQDARFELEAAATHEDPYRRASVPLFYLQEKIQGERGFEKALNGSPKALNT